MLLVFGGLPATGKSTLSKAIARAHNAVHLRVDTLEQQLRECGVTNIQGEGYALAYAVAADNLALGATVVADSVNPIELTRNAWRQVGIDAGVAIVNIEIVCSDPREHQQRALTRVVDVAGLVPPTWEEIVGRDYQPWQTERLLVDTAGQSIEQSVECTLALICAASSKSAS